jgi:hypothetical protein
LNREWMNIKDHRLESCTLSWLRYGPKVGWIILASRLQSVVLRSEKSVSLKWAR